jgi:hypothetical protein
MDQRHRFLVTKVRAGQLSQHDQYLWLAAVVNFAVWTLQLVEAFGVDDVSVERRIK